MYAGTGNGLLRDTTAGQRDKRAASEERRGNRDYDVRIRATRAKLRTTGDRTD